MQYDFTSNTFTVYIENGFSGSLNRTTSSEIILSKDFPLLGTETLGVTYKFTSPSVAAGQTTTTWNKLNISY